jgi:hypothetical protein
MSSIYQTAINETVINSTHRNETNLTLESANSDDAKNVMLTIKIVSLIVITSVTLIFGYLPMMW